MLKHPGNRACGRIPGICTITLARRWYVEGRSPTRRANRSLKLPRLDIPTSMQTSVIDSSSCASKTMARSSLDWIRNWCGVTPKRASNCRMKWNSDRLLSRAICLIASGSSRTSISARRAWHKRANACSPRTTIHRVTDRTKSRVFKPPRVRPSRAFERSSAMGRRSALSPLPQPQKSGFCGDTTFVRPTQKTI